MKSAKKKSLYKIATSTLLFFLAACSGGKTEANFSAEQYATSIDTLNAKKTYSTISKLPPKIQDTLYRTFLTSIVDNPKNDFAKIKPHIPFYVKSINDSTKAVGISNFYYGAYYFQKEKYDSAKVCLEIAIKKLPKNLYWKERTHATSYLAAIHANDGHYDKAIDLSIKTLKNIENHEGKNSWYYTENGLLSFTYSYAGERKKALETIDKSIRYFKHEGDKYNLAYHESSKSALLFANEQYEESYKLALHSLKLREELNDKAGMAESYNNIALYFSHINDYEKSLFYLQKAKELFYQVKSYTRLSTILGNIGFCLKKQNKLDEAIDAYHEALEIAKKLNQKLEMAQCYNALSGVYLMKEQYKEAFEYLAKEKDLENELLNIERMKTIHDLSIKYEIQKKNQLLLSRKKEIDLANYRFYWIFFVFLSISLTIMFIINYFRAKNKREKIKSDFRKELIELDAKKTIKALEIQILHAQMNPHFVFNCLCSIQNLFMKNDHYEANLKLSSFSKLLRLSIDHTRNNFVSVEDEINFIKLYVDLEQMQFENPINFSIINSCSTPIDDLEIPSMMIQPYVENAINHGLKNKTNNRQLTIEINESKDHFSIHIDDNGVGREEAEKIKKRSSHNHVSKGLSLVNEKIQALNEIYNIQVRSEIIDKFDHYHKTEGTTVILTFPKYFIKHFQTNKIF